MLRTVKIKVMNELEAIQKGIEYLKKLIQKLRNTKLLKINILKPPDTHRHVSAPGVYSMLMLKSFALHHF